GRPAGSAGRERQREEQRRVDGELRIARDGLRAERQREDGGARRRTETPHPVAGPEDRRQPRETRDPVRLVERAREGRRQRPRDRRERGALPSDAGGATEEIRCDPGQEEMEQEVDVQAGTRRREPPRERDQRIEHAALRAGEKRGAAELVRIPERDATRDERPRLVL